MTCSKSPTWVSFTGELWHYEAAQYAKESKKLLKSCALIMTQRHLLLLLEHKSITCICHLYAFISPKHVCALSPPPDI